MIKSLIIGAGQLGSRHLQGLLKFEMKQLIYVLDPSEKSLGIAKERAREVKNNHNLIYLNDWVQLPNDFDLVIVATGAKVRSRVVIKLLMDFKVKNLVLEKILFQDVNSYAEISELIRRTKTSTWVNHPRRMFKHYQEIKKVISLSEENVRFQVYGGNWGLACNGLHFVDLFSFLSDSEVEHINFDGVNEIVDSKRVNNIEFIGSIKGEFKNKSDFHISSIDGLYSDITVCVFTKSNRWIIQEGAAQKVIHLDGGINFSETITTYDAEFQSSLTTRIINDILTEEKTTLPTYDQASSSHIPFIKSALNTYTRITGIKASIIPIT